jgi:hypothetical protein
MDQYCIRSKTSGRYLDSGGWYAPFGTLRKKPTQFFPTLEQAQERRALYKEDCSQKLKYDLENFPNSRWIKTYIKWLEEPLEIVKITETVVG